MDADQAMEPAKQLAYDWACVELPNQRLTYTNYIKTITGLNVITVDINRPTVIFSAIIA